MTEQPQPPVAVRKPHQTQVHAAVLVDDYFWLRDRSDPAVIEYLQAENDYLNQVLAHTRPLQDQLFAELRARIKEDDDSAPQRDGDYFYFTRMQAGKQYPQFLRKYGSLDAPEELLLDQNLLAEGQSYCELGAVAVSPDGRLLAYAVDFAGDEVYSVAIKDLTSGELLPDQLIGVYYSLVWAEDNCTLYYNVLDSAMRPYRLYRHTLGQTQQQDVLVFEEADEKFFVECIKTRSREFLLLQLTSHGTSEIWFASAAGPVDRFTLVEPRREQIEYYVEHHGERFLIRSNDQAENFRLMVAPVSAAGRANWQELLPHRPDVLLSDVDAFADFLVLYERAGGLLQLRICDPQAQNQRLVQFPEPVYTYKQAANPEFHTTILRFVYSSLVTPDSVVDYDLHSGSWTVVKQEEIPSGYDPGQYASQRLFATAADGARVPISLVYKQSTPRDGTAPLLLYGYGSYGYSIDPGFSANRLSLLDRGFIFAIAHIRGGAEMGRAWYEQGRLLNKKNTFNDFIACAEHLIAERYTSPSRLAIQGGSAGGLLIGAVVNQRPELFNAAIAEVPFVDVINTMLDPSLPLVVIEYDQWGNPAQPEYFEYMRSYSPYDNVRAQAYPHMLVMGGLNDPRVSFWEPAKWVARLRATRTDNRLLLLHTLMDAGHGGASGRYDALKQIALKYAFLLEVLDVV